tara:strand:+ start:599 stop:1216 length:618 start_codon:yes stop_codon:yes gene_type:complete
MFWFFGKRELKDLKEETKNSFEQVKKDVEGVGKWIKHLDSQDKQLFEVLSEIKRELATTNDELEGLKEAISLVNLSVENRQLSNKTTAISKQQHIQGVQEAVQTPVQTGNFYDILQKLSGNERLIILTLMNSELKLSYEDVARLLGKERSTVRGQINSIKRKSEDLIQEIIESNGKKRVFVSEEIKEKLAKYAKVRVKSGKKSKK